MISARQFAAELSGGWWTVCVLLVSLTLGACDVAGSPDSAAHSHDSVAALRPLSLPTVQPSASSPDMLRVAATTGIIADVVGSVGGSQIALTSLMGPGQDPHSFQPTAQQIAAVAQAEVIFVNGWGLEEALLNDISASAPNTVQVPVAAGIEPLPLAEPETDSEGIGVPDPHTWLDPQLVQTWVANIERVLSALDPDNAEAYRNNAARYTADLEQLISDYSEAFDRIPAQRRLIVTNHDSLGYLAHAYDLEIVGTVLSGSSTLAEPSAAGLASLIAEMEAAGICTIFAETTADDSIARTVAQELENCPSVEVVQLYTGALGSAGSGADTYLDMMSANLILLQDALAAGQSQP
ncbi:MAG: metal ABC transporter substrate-binding protein [Candidatus Promineifilaceae bacterium]|nr:metal ABC transporter substrate-binding protein [Candidatus Promineifilaceae bacterium]